MTLHITETYAFSIFAVCVCVCGWMSPKIYDTEIKDFFSWEYLLVCVCRILFLE